VFLRVRPITRVMYVLFDLDDTLVHSDAVREAFAVVAREHWIAASSLASTLVELPGRPAVEIFEALGFAGDAARAACTRFFAVLDELNDRVPTVAYPDADTVLRELAARGSTLMLSTGSSADRAHRVLEQEGWNAFEVVLGSDSLCPKGHAHYDRIATEHADGGWVRDAVTIGDSPADMRLGAEHGVPVRIGIDRDGDPQPLLAAGATHVVRTLADILPIVTAA
jgi:phosphoglycolate phosphatase-like HAD superfamily hydrolase